jgi:hypothetical protein
MPQHPDGGERAHLDVESGVGGDNADAVDDGSHKLSGLLG